MTHPILHEALIVTARAAYDAHPSDPDVATAAGMLDVLAEAIEQGATTVVELEAALVTVARGAAEPTTLN
jgi:hypothetical protein